LLESRIEAGNDSGAKKSTPFAPSCFILAQAQLREESIMKSPAYLIAFNTHARILLSISTAYLTLASAVGCRSTAAQPPASPELNSTSEKKTDALKEGTVQAPAEKPTEETTAKHSSEKKDKESNNQQPETSASIASPSGGLTSPNPQQETADLARLRIEVLSLREKVDSLQRKFELVLRSQRSGIFQVENPDVVQAAVENAKNTPNQIPPLTREGPLDPFEFEGTTDAQQKPIEGPQALVDRALIYLSQSDYAKVLQLLEDFQSRFPNNPLNGTASLALAEAYVELQSPQRALAFVRGFYLQHPNDPRMPNAKWFEARIQEQMQSPQRAAQLYREVIALAPQSDLALKSRASLEKINEGRLQ
jgi:TolA-binding protein